MINKLSISMEVDSVTGKVTSAPVVLMTPVPTPIVKKDFAQKIQAENAKPSTGLALVSTIPYYEGKSHVDWFTKSSDKIDFTFSDVPEGVYTVNIRYAQYSPQENFLQVNGGVPQSIKFPDVSATWKVLSIPLVRLPAGTNIISLAKGSGYTYFDSLEVTSAGPVPTLVTPVVNATTPAVTPPTPTTTPTPAPTPAPISIPTPTPPRSGGYSFGSKKEKYVAGTLPTDIAKIDAATIKAYDKWVANEIKTGMGGKYVQFNGKAETVSEGVGYAMIIAVVMAGHDPKAQALFDDLYNVAFTHPAYATGEQFIMNWKIGETVTGTTQPNDIGGGWDAVDGDLDIAKGLLMAHRQWGSTTGRFDYFANALKTIDAIKRKRISSSGAILGMNHPTETRMSDYMFGHFKAFKQATGDAIWDKVYNRGLELMEICQKSFSPNTGLIPDFMEQADSTNPIPSRDGWGDPASGVTAKAYFWNANRIPLRLAAEYVLSGEPRIKAVLTKIVDFVSKDTQGNLINIREGYFLDGTGVVSDNIYWNPAAFTGPIAAGACVDAKFQADLDKVCTLIVQTPSNGYYDNELEMLSLFVLGGNWWKP